MDLCVFSVITEGFQEGATRITYPQRLPIVGSHKFFLCSAAINHWQVNSVCEERHNKTVGTRKKNNANIKHSNIKQYK
jgi:hypothetical protein